MHIDANEEAAPEFKGAPPWMMFEWPSVPSQDPAQTKMQSGEVEEMSFHLRRHLIRRPGEYVRSRGHCSRRGSSENSMNWCICHTCRDADIV